MALCAVSNINIMFVHRRKVFEFIPDVDNESNINIIHQYDEPSVRYAYETDVNNERIAIYKNSQDVPESSTVYFKSNSISNPLKAISSYKVAELKDLCVKLKLIDSKEIVKKTKPQVYEIIIKNLQFPIYIYIYMITRCFLVIILTINYNKIDLAVKLGLYINRTITSSYKYNNLLYT